ncbi:MAG: hypothetical protein K2M46_00490 [Lachnospiraceae bacterium]|nr:hypothetical protein [Lachnospiraceae bacterium]
MLAIIYLLVCLLTGYGIMVWMAPSIFDVTKQTYGKKDINVSPILVWLPAITITGVFLVTWTVYILGHFFASSRTPLVAANLITMAGYIGLSAVLLYLKVRKKQLSKPPVLCAETKSYVTEGGLLLCCIALATFLMFYTFHVYDGNLCIGYTVYSDFSPHMSMIRSFSYGNNFPTWYPYYTGIDVKYHFMFQFLAGNLEFLGMRIDYAFNIPSIISLVFVFMLLYVLTVKITGKKLAGWIAALLFAFRSSETLFTFLAETPEGESAWQRLKDNTEFLGYTTNENWGLWNLNVYANQRHLALCLAMMLLVLILVLPKLYETFEMWQEMKGQPEMNFQKYFKATFFEKSGWVLGDYKLAVFIGLLAGASAFWNGAALIALLLILFFIAALSKNRLDFVIMAGISGVLSLIQSKVFMQESSISAQYFFGFIAENKNLWGATDYILRLIGLLAILVVAAFLYYKGVKRYLIFVFTTPFIFSFTVSLTVDPTVNHKYIMMSCMLLDVMVAGFITDFIQKKDVVRYIGAALLVVFLTATGIYDTYSIYVRNGGGREVSLNLNDPVTEWVHENADSKDVFLTAPYTVNPVTMGGAMLYNGWEYFAWSAGYDTGYRDVQVAAMYSAATSEELMSLVEENEIDYIVVDIDARNQEGYTVNEEVIAQTYGVAYTQGEGNYKFTIYDTRENLYYQ